MRLTEQSRDLPVANACLKASCRSESPALLIIHAESAWYCSNVTTMLYSSFSMASSRGHLLALPSPLEEAPFSKRATMRGTRYFSAAPNTSSIGIPDASIPVARPPSPGEYRWGPPPPRYRTCNLSHAFFSDSCLISFSRVGFDTLQVILEVPSTREAKTTGKTKTMKELTTICWATDNYLQVSRFKSLARR